jgi:hypothetical protein
MVALRVGSPLYRGLSSWDYAIGLLQGLVVLFLDMIPRILKELVQVTNCSLGHARGLQGF